MRPYGTDANGRTPQVGDFVAYNYSGQIATGWITKIGHRISKYSSLGGNKIYHIHQVAPHEGKKSVVRGGAKCLIVLESGEGLVKEIFV